MGVLGELRFLCEGYITPGWEIVLSSFVQQLTFAVGNLWSYRVDGYLECLSILNLLSHNKHGSSANNLETQHSNRKKSGPLL